MSPSFKRLLVGTSIFLFTLLPCAILANTVIPGGG
jgi:hypothetical protein